MTSVSKKLGAKENFGKNDWGEAAFFSLLKYGGADRFHEKSFGGLKAILTAEAGGGQNDFSGPKKPRFLGAFPADFGHSLKVSKK